MRPGWLWVAQRTTAYRDAEPAIQPFQGLLGQSSSLRLYAGGIQLQDASR
jgi:hypothetical protein